MDYHSLKRRELQALCKEHNIPANSANSVLADKLSALLNEKEKPKARLRTCIKSLVETTDEGEPAAAKRQSKKVRFNPNDDLHEYDLWSAEKQKDTVTQMKTRRKSVANKVDKPSVDNTITDELVEDTVQIPVRVTRSGVIIPNNERKKGRRQAKDVEKETDVDKETEGNVGKVTRSKAHTLQKVGAVQREDNKQSKKLTKEVEEATESVEEAVVGRVRVTRSKAQTSVDGDTGRDANPSVKRKTGKQVKTDEQSVEPPKEIMVPARATRSTRQTLKEDAGNPVTNPQADKKRTRREMKATDSSSDLSHVAPVDKQEPPKRKSLRTRGVDEDKGEKMEVVANSRVTRSKAPLAVEDSGRNNNKAKKNEELEEPLKHAGKKNVNRRKTVDEDEGEKMEVVANSRVTRSKAPVEMEDSGRNNKSKAKQNEELEEPLKHAGKKNVNRRKSVLQPEKTEVDPHHEEAVNVPARKDTRRKSVMPKETKTVESPTVGKRQSKRLSGNFEDKGNVTRSGKNVSENDFEEVTIGTPKSRKRKGTPIIEDQIIKTEYGSLVDKSPKSSTRSASKSEAKSVAKSQVESSSKKPMSKMNMKQTASPKEKSSAIRSGAVIRDGSSKKRAKLSATKQNDSEDHAVISGKEGTPVAKMSNFKLAEEVTKAEVTPAVDKSNGRFTRSSIRSEIKTPSQSAIKEQSIAESQSFSPKGAKFRPDTVFNTAPGRVTRSGIKHGGNAAGSFTEVGKKKQTRQSALKKPLDDTQMASPKAVKVRPDPDIGTIGDRSEVKQPLGDVQMSSHDVADVQRNPDGDTVEVGSEISKERSSQILGESSASESVGLPAKIISGTAIDIESTPVVSGEDAFGEVMENAGACIENSTYEASATPCVTESGKQQNPSELLSSDNETPLGKNLSHIGMTSVSVADVAENVVDAVSDLSRVQNQKEVFVESGLFSEDVHVETSVLKSGSPDATEKEIESTESGSASKGIDISSFGVATEGNVDDADNCHPISATGDKMSGSVSVKISSVDKHDIPDDGEQYDEDGSTSAQKPLVSEPDSEDSDVADGVDVQENPFSSNEILVECDDAISDQKSPLHMLGTPLTGRGDVHDDDVNALKELETTSEPSNANKTLDVPFSSIDIDIERTLEDNSDVQDGESEHDQLTSNANHATDEEDARGDDSEPAQMENVHAVAEVLVGSHDQEPEQSLNVAVDDVPLDMVGQSGSVTSKDAPKDRASSGIDDMVVRVDAPEESVVDMNKDVVSSLLGDIYDMDDEGDSGNEQKVTEVDEGFQPNESMGIFSDMSNEQPKEEAETSSGNDNTLDDQEQAASADNNSDSTKFMEDDSHIGVNEVDSELVGNIEHHEDPTREEASPILNTKGEHDMYDVGDSGNEQKLTEVDEGFQANESRGIFSDMSNEQTKEEAETSRGNDHTLDDQEQAASTDDNSDSTIFMEDGSHIGVNEVDSELVGNIQSYEDPTREEASPIFNTTGEHSSQLMGDIGAHEKLNTKESLPITYKNEESPVDDTGSDLPVSKEDDRNNQGTSVDWGDYDFEADEFEKPVSTNRSADVEGKDYQDSDLQASARTSSSIEESSGLAVGLTNSVRKMENDSRLDADGKSNQEADMLKGSANAAATAEEDFNWSDPSLKSLFATPATTRISHVTTGQAAGVNLANQDHYSSLKQLFRTPVVTQNSRVKDGRDVKTVQDASVDVANQDPYSSLKPLFKTPATTQISHLKDGRDVKTGQEDTVDFANQDHYSSLKPLFRTPTVTQVSHVKDGQEDAVSYANQDPYSSLKPLFTTPATTQIDSVKLQEEATTFANKNHYSSLKSLFATPATSKPYVNDRKDDAVNFTFPEGRRNEHTGSSSTAAHEFNHPWGNDQSKDFNSDTQGNNSVHGPENEIHERSSFEDYHLKLFEDEVGGSVDRSGRSTNFEFKQFEFLNEAAGTSHPDPSGLKDDSTRSCEFEKQEDTLMTGSEVNDDLAFGTGHGYDYRGNTQ